MNKWDNFEFGNAAIQFGQLAISRRPDNSQARPRQRPDAKVFKKYSQMKLQMKREALEKLNRRANEAGLGFGTVKVN